MGSIIRLVTAGIRFLFLLFLSYSGNENIIIFLALSYAIHGFLVFILPFDYYVSVIHYYRNFSRRALIKIAEHWVFLSISIVLSLTISIGSILILDLGFLYILLSLIISVDCINSEINRILITRGENFISAILLFLRWGGWPIVIIAHSLYGISINSLMISLYWLLSVTVAMVLGAWFCSRKISGLLLSLVSNVKKESIYIALKKGLSNLGSTISIRAIFTLDRFAVSYIYDDKALVLYQLSLSLVSISTILVDSVTVPRYYGLFFNKDICRKGLITKFIGNVILMLMVNIFLHWMSLKVINIYHINMIMPDLYDLVPFYLFNLVFLCIYPFSYLNIRDGKLIFNTKMSILSLFVFIASAAIIFSLSLDYYWFSFIIFLSFSSNLALRVIYEKRKNSLVL